MSVTPEQNETQKPRTLFGGIMKVLSGVDDIQDALKRWRLWFVAVGMCMAVGGVADRSQGFPMAHWAAKGLIPDRQSDAAQLRRIERKTDSTLREQSKIKAAVDTLAVQVKTVSDTLASVQKSEKKTQAVVQRIAVLTKTDKTIIREREKSRGLFGDIWGID